MPKDTKLGTVTVQTNHGLEYTVRVAELTPDRPRNTGSTPRQSSAVASKNTRVAATAQK